MGLINSVKEKVSSVTGGGSGSGAPEDEWATEIESQVDEKDEEMEIEEGSGGDVGQEEWDSAYRFAEEFLEKRGFSSMMDFTNKCMAYQINKSPMYRDRISTGMETMDRITTVHSQLENIKGGQSNDDSLEEKAKKVSAANELIDETQKLAGEEEAMVRDAMGLGQDLVEALAKNASSGRSQESVNSNIKSRKEEM